MSLLLRAVIEDHPQNNNVYGIWSTVLKVVSVISRSLRSQECHLRVINVCIITIIIIIIIIIIFLEEAPVTLSGSQGGPPKPK